MDLTHLTKKNQEFVHIATKQLIQDGKSDQEIKEILETILPTIIENQQKGVTARASLGAPTTWAKTFSETNSTKNNDGKTEKNDNPWLMWLDTSLLFVGVVALLNAVMGFFNAGSKNPGILSLLALGFGGGAAMYAMYHFVYRQSAKPKAERSNWIKTIIILALAMLGWVLLSTATSMFLPPIINPQLPAIAMLIIGAIALIVRYLLQKKYNILNAMTPPKQSCK